jgi:hypothetical protein
LSAKITVSSAANEEKMENELWDVKSLVSDTRILSVLRSWNRKVDAYLSLNPYPIRHANVKSVNLSNN